MVEQRNDDDEFQDCVDDVSQSKCSNSRLLDLPFLSFKDEKSSSGFKFRIFPCSLAIVTRQFLRVTDLFLHVMLFRVQSSNSQTEQQLRLTLVKR